MVWQAPFFFMVCLNIATKILPLSIAHFPNKYAQQLLKIFRERYVNDLSQTRLKLVHDMFEFGMFAQL